jgi:hypothetical protein
MLLPAGLFRLGWMRHGEPPFDLYFLHLDWTLRTDLPYWSAHMSNLAFVVIGIGIIITGGTMIVRCCLLQRARA